MSAPWCATCGRDGPVDAQGDCLACAKWWADNPPPDAPISDLQRSEIVTDYLTKHIAPINALCTDIHADNVKAGWWTNPHTGESILETRNVGEILMLIVSEVAEGMEGHRKSLMDDKLPHRPMLEVELADAVIRIADLAGAKGFDLGGAIAEKRAFNASRADHKLENRLAPGGKAY